MLQFLSSSSSLEVRVGPDEDRLSAAEHATATSPRLSVCDPGGPLDMCHGRDCRSGKHDDLW